MNGLSTSNDSLRDANRARKQVLVAELERIQAQKAAVERQIAALGRGPAKASQLALGGVKKRPSKAAPVDDLRPDKRPKIQTDWPKKEQTLWTTCSSILKSLSKGSLSYVFMAPVNTAALPDYASIVKKPMDLGTVTKRLNHKNRQYTDPLQFRDDVRQVWKNCALYNPVESQVGKAGINLSDKFEKEWSKYMVEDKWNQLQLAKQQELQEGGGVSAEELNRLGRHLRDVTDRIEIGTNPGPANASRDMNYDEKRKLSIFMGELDGDKLGEVIEIISQDQEDGLPGGQDGEIELDIDQLSRKTLWALYDLYMSNQPKAGGPPRKGGGGRSATPGVPRGGSAGPANQPEVSSQLSPDMKREGSGATQGGASAQRPAPADSSTSSDSSSDDEDRQAQPRKQAGAGPTLMSSNHTQGPSILPSGAGKARQDTTLANKEAWAGLANSPAVQDEDEGMQEAGDDGDADGLWNNFQSQDDAEREQKQQQVRQKEEAIRRQKEQEAKQKVEAAEKALLEQQQQKAAEASRQEAEQAARLQAIADQQAKDRALLEAQAQGNNLEDAKNVHKMLHKVQGPTDTRQALQEDEDDQDFGDDDDEGGGGGEDGEMEEI